MSARSNPPRAFSFLYRAYLVAKLELLLHTLPILICHPEAQRRFRHDGSRDLPAELSRTFKPASATEAVVRTCRTGSSSSFAATNFSVGHLCPVS